MSKLTWAIISILTFGGCGRTKEKEKEPAPAPSPVPPATSPKPEPPTNKWPQFPFPIPGLPSLPNFPLPIPGGGGANPSPSPAPNPMPPLEGDPSGVGAAINEARAARGLSAVMVLPALNCAAKRHAQDIGTKGVCGHYGSDGSSPWDRAKDCGTSANGEIVACGQGSPKAAVDAWTLSPGHAAIMYDPGQKMMGVYMVNNYWVAIFQK